MGLEELIVAWSNERPAWQRDILRRVAVGDGLSGADYDQLLKNLLENKAIETAHFGIENLPEASSEDQPVVVLTIQNPEHVNALESKESLTFEAQGLTIVYGDNGSGKSGYARLLKRITRARHREDVLTDVFRDSALAKPTAEVRVRIGQVEEYFSWPQGSRPELQRILFYDASCGTVYVANESDFPYRPSALFVLDGLIEACVEIRARIDLRLAHNAASAATLPLLTEPARDSEAGRYLRTLSAASSVEVLDALITKFDRAGVTIDELIDQENRLRHGDTTKARLELVRERDRLEVVRKHVENLASAIGGAMVDEVRSLRDTLATLEEAESRLAQTFESESLPGVGTSAWKALWAAARAFSEQHVYIDEAFPFLGETSRCVLCQQILEAPSRDRFARFDEFVKNDIEAKLQEVTRAYDEKVWRLRNLSAFTDVTTDNLKDLEPTHAQLVSDTRALLSEYETAIEQIRESVVHYGENPTIGIEADSIVSRLTHARDAARVSADALGNPEEVQRQITAMAEKRAELELLKQMKETRSTIVHEIERLRERDALDAAKSSAATTGITKKILELSEESITEVVRDTFTRETERLRLERVTIARTRAEKGALLHQPKLVGARQQINLPRVFSEGERTALGLAAFFTEAQLDGSRSALILDDPVTSLDHIRRELVAARLAVFAESRQVIIFTHDVSFVADLKREAGARGVSVAERSVNRSRAGERKPGACTENHPWKAKDVPARLNELRGDLQRIRKDCDNWSEKEYEEAVALWAGNLSETWERVFSQEVVGPILAEGGLEVRPMMVKILARFTDDDRREFDGSYSRTSQWARRHDKSAAVNYVAPDVTKLDEELRLIEGWFKRIKGYKA